VSQIKRLSPRILAGATQIRESDGAARSFFCGPPSVRSAPKVVETRRQFLDERLRLARTPSTTIVHSGSVNLGSNAGPPAVPRIEMTITT